MNGYLLCVIGTVLVCSILTAITPEGKTSAVIKGVARLTCILAIIAPVLSFLKTGDVAVFNDKNSQEFFLQEGIDGQVAFIQYYSEMRIEQTQQALQSEIKEKYNLDVEVVLVWRQEQEQIRIDEIRLKLLKATDEEVVEKVWEYLTKNYCSEVLIE